MFPIIFYVTTEKKKSFDAYLVTLFEIQTLLLKTMFNFPFYKYSIVQGANETT